VEIRARYLQMGAFTLAVLVAGFVFVYWLNSAEALRDRMLYRVRFEGSVSGLQKGSAVLFNGVRVGEVAELRLDPVAPRQVHSIIAVDRGAPIRADTAVSIDFQGLTGSPVIALLGGTSDRHLLTTGGEPPLLFADAAAAQSTSQAARDVLQRLDGVLADNAAPLRSMIGNLETFSGVLARNSDRLDGIVAGLERMTAGSASKARLLGYELAVPPAPAPSGSPIAVQLVVPDPTALAQLDSERIQTLSADGVYANLPDAQWSDALPKLLQVKVLRGLEDAGRFAGVSRPLEGVTSDAQLLLDVRKFQISPEVTAEVEIGCKLIAADGRIITTRTFRATAPVAGQGAAAAVKALNRAFAEAGAQLLSWTAQAASEPSALRAVGGKRGSGD
jgi:phospholipid/cholesterol/gamma-HCH transport system substrate-binding protein